MASMMFPFILKDFPGFDVFRWHSTHQRPADEASLHEGKALCIQELNVKQLTI